MPHHSRLKVLSFSCSKLGLKWLMPPQNRILGFQVCPALALVAFFLPASSPVGYRSLPGIQLGVHVCDGLLTSTLWWFINVHTARYFPTHVDYTCMVASLISPAEGTDCLSPPAQERHFPCLVSRPPGAAMSRQWSSRLSSDPDSLDYSSFPQGIDSIFSLTARLFLEDSPVLHTQTPHLTLTSALYLLTCLNEGHFTPWHSHSSKWCDV